jgi:hypothetical protein
MPPKAMKKVEKEAKAMGHTVKEHTAMKPKAKKVRRKSMSSEDEMVKEDVLKMEDETKKVAKKAIKKDEKKVKEVKAEMKEIKPRKKRSDSGKPRVKKEKKEAEPVMAGY